MDTNLYLLTYLFPPRSRVLLEKPTGAQLFKKFHAFKATRRFITAFASARHLYLYQSMLHAILTLFFYLLVDIPGGLLT
jgi:hypothetical protein